MSIVYVTQDVMVRENDGNLRRKFNLAPAEKYGELRILVPYGCSMASSVPIVRQLREQLKTFTEHDYLLPLGDPSIMAAASAIAAQQSNGRLRVLKWDRRMPGYLVVVLDLSGKAL